MAMCPKCGGPIDTLYNVCTLCYSKSKSAIEFNSELLNKENDGILRPNTFSQPVSYKSATKSVLSTIAILLLIIGVISVVVSYLSGVPSSSRPDNAPARSQPPTGTGTNASYFHQYTNLQPPYLKSSGEPIHLINNPDARNVSYSSLCYFIWEDKTDDEMYIHDQRMCGYFAEMVHNNAEQKGIKAAWVGITFENQDIGHAINAFQTTDRGLAYMDCTGQTRYQGCSVNDRAAYVEKGKEYGTIEFEKADSLDYSFYIRYKQEWQEYHAKMEQHNNDVEAYNRALGGRTLLAEPEYSRFQAWQQRLKQQEPMLDELSQKLGQCYSYESMGIVKTVDLYW